MVPNNVQLLTPPATPPSARKQSVSGGKSLEVSAPPHKHFPHIPTELWALIIEHVDAAPDLFALLTVSKAWHAIAARQLYKYISFTSLKQRNAFAGKRLCGSKNAGLAVEMQWLTGKLQCASIEEQPASPVALAAESPTSFSPPTITCPVPGASDLQNLVKGIDFGFRSTPKPSVPSYTPTPTPTSSTTNTPSNSAPSSPNMLPASIPNSVALAADILNNSSLEYGAWSHRSVSPILYLISVRCTQLTYLGLSGCQFDSSVFTDAIGRLPDLKQLDISFSNVRNEGLMGIAKHGKNLRCLDVSGVFKYVRLS